MKKLDEISSVSLLNDYLELSKKIDQIDDYLERKEQAKLLDRKSQEILDFFSNIERLDLYQMLIKNRNGIFNVLTTLDPQLFIDILNILKLKLAGSCQSVFKEMMIQDGENILHLVAKNQNSVGLRTFFNYLDDRSFLELLKQGNNQKVTPLEIIIRSHTKNCIEAMLEKLDPLTWSFILDPHLSAIVVPNKNFIAIAEQNKFLKKDDLINIKKQMKLHSDVIATLKQIDNLVEEKNEVELINFISKNLSPAHNPDFYEEFAKAVPCYLDLVDGMEYEKIQLLINVLLNTSTRDSQIHYQKLCLELAEKLFINEIKDEKLSKQNLLNILTLLYLAGESESSALIKKSCYLSLVEGNDKKYFSSKNFESSDRYLELCKEEIIPLLNRLVKNYPDNVLLRTSLIQILFESEYYQAAYENISNIPEFLRSTDINYMLGLIGLEHPEIFPDKESNISKAFNLIVSSAKFKNIKALNYLKSLANEESKLPQMYVPKAQTILGKIFQHVNLDINEAVHWYGKAISNNNAEAMYQLAMLYWEGKDIAKDTKKATDLFLKSANLGFQSSIEFIIKNVQIPSIQYNMGLLLLHGNEWVKTDYKQAIKCLLFNTEYFTAHSTPEFISKMLSEGISFVDEGQVKFLLTKLVDYKSKETIQHLVTSNYRIRDIFFEQLDHINQSNSLDKNFLIELFFSSDAVCTDNEDFIAKFFLDNIVHMVNNFEHEKIITALQSDLTVCMDLMENDGFISALPQSLIVDLLNEIDEDGLGDTDFIVNMIHKFPEPLLHLASNKPLVAAKLLEDENFRNQLSRKQLFDLLNDNISKMEFSDAICLLIIDFLDNEEIMSQVSTNNAIKLLKDFRQLLEVNQITKLFMHKDEKVYLGLSSFTQAKILILCYEHPGFLDWANKNKILDKIMSDKTISFHYAINLLLASPYCPDMANKYNREICNYLLKKIDDKNFASKIAKHAPDWLGLPNSNKYTSILSVVINHATLKDAKALLRNKNITTALAEATYFSNAMKLAELIRNKRDSLQQEKLNSKEKNPSGWFGIDYAKTDEKMNFLSEQLPKINNISSQQELLSFIDQILTSDKLHTHRRNTLFGIHLGKTQFENDLENLKYAIQNPIFDLRTDANVNQVIVYK